MTNQTNEEQIKFIDCFIREFSEINTELRNAADILKNMNYRLGFNGPEKIYEENCNAGEVHHTFKDELNLCLNSYISILNVIKHELNQMSKNV